MDFASAVQGAAYDATRSGDTAGLEEACTASVEALKRLVGEHYHASSKAAAGSGLEGQQHQAVQQARQDVLDTLMHKLDVAVATLGDLLEELADHQPSQHLPEPQEVIAYAHKLRYTTFAKMGTISLPPAPQPWQVAQSTLYRFGMEQAARQPIQLQQPAAVGGPRAGQAPPQPAAAAPQAPSAPAYQEGYTLQDGTGLPTQPPAAAPVQEQQDVVLQAPVAAAAAPAAAPARAAAGGIDLGLILNPDMEEVSYTESDEDSDDDFI